MSPCTRQSRATLAGSNSVVAPFHVYLDRLVLELERAWGVPEGAGRVLRAWLAHAVAFGAWRSPTANGLSDGSRS